MLNESKGNMYGFVTHTWNPIKGKCLHNCDYCYMKRWGKQKPARLVEKELKINLGKGNFIFVGSGTDIFASDIPDDWIRKVLDYCNSFLDNKYLFQSKNPSRMICYESFMPEDSIVATTIETNRIGFSYNAPIQKERMYYISRSDLKKMITIEPIIDFDIKEFVEIIKYVKPFQVAIGADSQKNNLPEPNKDKILQLISELKKFTKVVIKPNLKRITKEEVKQDD